MDLIDKTKKTIPLLTNKNLLENDTKIKISELANRIEKLSLEFKKKDYPYETSEQRSKRLQLMLKARRWLGCIWQLLLIIKLKFLLFLKPDKGLKFDAAAQELKLISDEFFKLRNHNFKFKSAIKKIKR